MATIPCPHCKGKGRIAVTGVYADTLQRLRKACKKLGYVVANLDALYFGCKPTALNNRLAWLEEHGLARSEKFGRQRRFYAKD